MIDPFWGLVACRDTAVVWHPQECSQHGPSGDSLGLEVIILCCLDGFCSYAVAGLYQSFVIPAGVNKDTGAAFLDPKPIR
jgi:hypothetical protein